MELLNVGCGTKVFNYAINIDIEDEPSLNIIKCDANALDELYEPNSIDVIYMLCPFVITHYNLKHIQYLKNLVY